MCHFTLPGLFRLAWLPFFALTMFTSVVQGQLTDADRARLVAEVKAAAENLDASRLPDLVPSRSAVLGAMEEVQRLLATQASEENRQAWLKYLDLQPLRQALESDQPAKVIGRQATQLRYRLIGTAPGLERDELQSLRRDTEALIAALRFQNKDQALELIARQLESLSQRIEQLDEVPSAEDIAAITAILGLLDTSGQATDSLHSLREAFDQPNIAFSVGESLVQQLVHQDVDQTRPVRDCILGTRIVGSATMNGVVTANVLPADDVARMQVSLAGHVVSNNTGFNGPVRLRTVGYGDVNVSRAVRISDSGIEMAPSRTEACLRTEIRPIEHKLRLVRKIARKKAAQQKPLADRIALGKMRRQVGQQFTRQTDQALNSASPQALAKLRMMLQRLSLSDPGQQWASTDDHIHVNSAFRREDQLATVTARPAIEVPYELAIQLHESVINNVCSPVLAGRTLSEKQLNRLLKEVGRPLPSASENEGEEPEPPFEIDFARLQSIVFEARDHSIRIGVRGTRFAQGRRELKRAMEITAIYHPVKSQDGKITLQREGEVKVNFPGGKRLTVSQAGLKPTIQKKFAGVFPAALMDRPLEVPETTSIEPLKGRVFEPLLVDANQGWLTIALR